MLWKNQIYCKLYINVRECKEVSLVKHIFKLTILLMIAFLFSGCTDKNFPLLSKETDIKLEDEEISYTIEQVVLSKGYQSIEPNVEILKKNKLLVSLGLLETSGVEVSKIIKRGNTINIHLNNDTNELEKQLAVPQIFIELKNLKAKKLDDMNFNIVNENYKPLSVKLGLNEIVKKISSEFKVTAQTPPAVNLLNIDDKIVWDVTYSSIFDRDNPETPLVNLSVQVDANSGEILQSSKSFISTYIDGGNIMDYVVNKYILYKKTESDGSKKIENIWYYDIEKNEKNMIYTSTFKIISALFSPDSKNISILESTESNTDLYIISREDNKAYKVFFQENNNPKLIRWKDSDNLYIVENTKGKSNVFSYNTKENILELVTVLDTEVMDIRVGKENILITENHNEEINSKLSYTDDFKYLRFFDFGFNQRLLDKDKICYLKKDDKEDRNQLIIYDINDKEQYDNIDMNVTNFFVLPNNNIFIVEKNQGNNDYSIHEYDINDMKLTPITKVNSDNIYYNKEKDLIYVNLSIPFDTEYSEIIYSINLSKLVSLEP